jgi:RNase H-like domain found in reverse transcriptase/Integrase zinc binding domain
MLILVFLSKSGCFQVEADASGYVTGAVISQLQDDGKWHLVGFLLKSLSEAKRNYNIYNKELMAVIWALEAWRHYLEGFPHTIEILMDHQNLQYFWYTQKLNWRQARWSIFLSQFNFTLQHCSGTQSGKPDALSHHSDHPRGDSDNSDMVLLKPSSFRTCAMDAMEAVTVDGPSWSLMARIKRAMEIDDKVVQIVKELNGDGPKVHLKDWELQGSTVLFCRRVYVPLDSKLCHDLLHEHHDTPTTGHPGWWKTYELVSHHYWWPGMSRYIATYVSTCDICN